MQNTFSPSTKGGKTLPGRSLILCEQQKHKLLFTSHLLPPPPWGASLQFIPKVWYLKKINNKVFTAHFPAQLTSSSWLLGANKMHLRSAGVLHHPGIHLLKISMPAVLTQNPGVILHFHHYFNPGSIYIFFSSTRCFWSDSQISSEVTDKRRILLQLIPVDSSETQRPVKLKEWIINIIYKHLFRYVNNLHSF